jgi:hypothetical protein
MRTTDMIVIHCAATPNGRHNTVEDIDKWHRAKGWQRKPRFMREFNPNLTSIGYHYVIYPDGTVHTGRSPEEIGAHAVGYNTRSLGVCLLGTDRYTSAQWDGLKKLIQDISPGKQIVGHRDLPGVGKSCPGFDVASWLAGGMRPVEGHLLTKG